MRKIQLNIGIILEEGIIDCPPEFETIPESAYWRLGVGIIGGRSLNIERKTSLGDVEFRIGDSTLRNQDVECWMPIEYQDWRDG